MSISENQPSERHHKCYTLPCRMWYHSLQTTGFWSKISFS